MTSEMKAKISPMLKKRDEDVKIFDSKESGSRKDNMSDGRSSLPLTMFPQSS